MQPGQSGWRAAAAAAFVLAAGLLAVFDWRRGAGGTLAWDGATWRWASAGRSASGRVAVRLDLQHSLLIRFDAPPVRQWLWLERKLQPGSWDDLRRAVYSHAAANP